MQGCCDRFEAVYVLNPHCWSQCIEIRHESELLCTCTGYSESQILSVVAWVLFDSYKTESFDADLLQRSCTENILNWSHVTNALSRTLRRSLYYAVVTTGCTFIPCSVSSNCSDCPKKSTETDSSIVVSGSRIGIGLCSTIFLLPQEHIPDDQRAHHC